VYVFEHCVPIVTHFLHTCTISKNMGPLPSGEAKRYGDRNFKAMMYAKVRMM